MSESYASGSCAKHRRAFITILAGYGLMDWVVMDRTRSLFIAEAGRRFSNQQIRRWVTSDCIACDHENWSVAMIHRLAEEEAALMSLEYQAQQNLAGPNHDV